MIVKRCKNHEVRDTMPFIQSGVLPDAKSPTVATRRRTKVYCCQTKECTRRERQQSSTRGRTSQHDDRQVPDHQDHRIPSGTSIITETGDWLPKKPRKNGRSNNGKSRSRSETRQNQDPVVLEQSGEKLQLRGITDVKSLTIGIQTLHIQMIQLRVVDSGIPLDQTVSKLSCKL